MSAIEQMFQSWFMVMHESISSFEPDEYERLQGVLTPAKAELAALRARVLELEAPRTCDAELAALKEKVLLAYWTNDYENEEASRKCDAILAGALGHKVRCLALGATPKPCTCGGVSK